MTMVGKWTQEMRSSFRNSVFTFQHALTQSDLFSDEALIALIEKHPASLMDICTMGPSDNTRFPNKLRTGDFRGCTSQEIFQAAKTGRIWINLRRAMNIHPEYKNVLDQMYDGVKENAECRAFHAVGGILITSPVARTPYHFDKTETILWHVRGAKQISIYPVEEKFIPDVAYEQAVTNLLDDDLPYDEAFDADAIQIDLKEGEAVSWPLSAPHRVENNGFCVSVTTEFTSRQSAFKNAAMVANATMRDKFGTASSWNTQSRLHRCFKAALGVTLTKTKLALNTQKADFVSFKIAPKNPGALMDVQPFERDY